MMMVMNHERWWLVCALLVVVGTSHLAQGFAVVPSPGVTTRQARYVQEDHHHYHPGRHERSGVVPLFVVADPPNKEEEEIERNKRNNDDSNNNNNSGAWIKTTSGGFLPRLPRKHLAPQRRKRPVVHEVLTIQEYKSIVVEEKNQMVCVRFYAPWCRACKAIQERFRAFPRKYPSVKFVEVPLTRDNAFLHEGLGVPSLPFAHLYHPEAGLVEERKIKKQVFADFENILSTYVDGGCTVKYDDENNGMAVST